MRLTGKVLAKRYGVDAVQSLYREDGRWYHLLKVFPGALFDANGYIRFENAEQYAHCDQIKRYEHKDQAIVQPGIFAIPGYQKFSAL